MSDRFTRADAENAFDRWLRLVRGQRATWTGSGHPVPGRYFLDYLPYGGYAIERQLEGGGVTRVNNRRMTAKEFHYAVEFTAYTLVEKERNDLHQEDAPQT